MTSENEETVHQQCGTDEPAPGNAGNEVEDALALWTETVSGPCRCLDCTAAIVILAEVRRLREENNRLYEMKSIALGVGDGSGQKFVYGNSESILAAKQFIINCGRLRSELELKITTSAQIAAENVRLREELDKSTRPGDPACASDAEQDVDYWRLKAREHFTSYLGLDCEHQQLRAKLARVEALRGKMFDVNTHAAVWLDDLEAALK